MSGTCCECAKCGHNNSWWCYYPDRFICKKCKTPNKIISGKGCGTATIFTAIVEE